MIIHPTPHHNNPQHPHSCRNHPHYRNRNHQDHHNRRRHKSHSASVLRLEPVSGSCRRQRSHFCADRVSLRLCRSCRQNQNRNDCQPLLAGCRQPYRFPAGLSLSDPGQTGKSAYDCPCLRWKKNHRAVEHRSREEHFRIRRSALLGCNRWN